MLNFVGVYFYCFFSRDTIEHYEENEDYECTLTQEQLCKNMSVLV